MTPRRVFLTQVSTLGAATILLRSVAALADNDALVALTRAYAGGGPVREGRVTLEIAPLVDNGNSVPITVSVLSPMTAADRVVGIAVFKQAKCVVFFGRKIFVAFVRF